MAQPISLALIEDDLIVRCALEHWLRTITTLKVVGFARTAQESVALVQSTQVEMVLMDLVLPDIDGLALAAQLKATQRGLRVLILSGSESANTIWRVMNSRVEGFVGKSEHPKILQEGLLAVARGKPYFSPLFVSQKQRLQQDCLAFTKILTRRQTEVLYHLAAGMGDDEIARALEIAPATVSVHRKALRAKLGVHDDRGLVRYAREWGFD